jgi:hypothetical protein
MSKSWAILTLCLAACGASAVFSQRDLRANPVAAAEHKHGDVCADVCSKCANTCSSCVEHCLAQLAAGKKEHATTLRLCNDCGDLCSLAARMESRRGPLRLLACDACAKACDQCAAECNKYKDQPHMVECAKECVACAAACREMIQHTGHAK